MADRLKSYPAPWKGRVVLACRKCQKKLKGHKHLAGLAKMRKSAKRFNREHPESQIHLVQVGCMDLCPKDGITVCDPGWSPPGLVILRSEEDLLPLANASGT